MVTDIWLKRVENGASQILGKLNSIEKKGSQRKNKLIEQNTLVWRDGAASKYEILRLVTKNIRQDLPKIFAWAAADGVGGSCVGKRWNPNRTAYSQAQQTVVRGLLGGVVVTSFF